MPQRAVLVMVYARRRDPVGAEVLDHVGELEYVDLRFGNRVFYKLKGQEAVGQ